MCRGSLRRCWVNLEDLFNGFFGGMDGLWVWGLGVRQPVILLGIGVLIGLQQISFLTRGVGTKDSRHHERASRTPRGVLSFYLGIETGTGPCNALHGELLLHAIRLLLKFE